MIRIFIYLRPFLVDEDIDRDELEVVSHPSFCEKALNPTNKILPLKPGMNVITTRFSAANFSFPIHFNTDNVCEHKINLHFDNASIEALLYFASVAIMIFVILWVVMK